MSLITIDQARRQVRDLQLSEADAQDLIDRATSYVVGFLDRDVYETDAELATARTAAPTAFAAGLADISTRVTAAQAETDVELRNALLTALAQESQANRHRYLRTMAGIVVTGRVQSAILLELGHLYSNTEAVIVDQGVQVVELPLGVTAVAWPDRRLGV